MMESVAFKDSHLIEDDDYVFVNANNMRMSMDIDEEEYSYEDEDDFVVFSLPSTVHGDIEPKTHPKEIKLSSSVVSIEDSETKFNDEIDELLTKLENSPGDNLSDVNEKIPESNCISEKSLPPKNDSQPMSKIESSQTDSKKETNYCGSRLSNKKRRKRLKMMKKAAAAAEAAASLAEMRQKSSDPSPSTRKSRKPKHAKSKKQHNNCNIAVVCATESLNEYREKHNV